MSFRRQPVATSQKDCAAIDFKEGFIQREMSGIEELKQEILSLKDKISQPPLPVAENAIRMDTHMHHKKHENRNTTLEKLQRSVSKKIATMEKKYNVADKIHDDKDILMKLSNIERKIEAQSVDKSLCTHTEQLKSQVFDRIEKLENKIRNNEDQVNNLQSSFLDVNSSASNEEEDKVKLQVLEKLAHLENHIKLKSEIPVVNSEILRAEELKLSKLLSMREKLIRGF